LTGSRRNDGERVTASLGEERQRAENGRGAIGEEERRG